MVTCLVTAMVHAIPSWTGNVLLPGATFTTACHATYRRGLAHTAPHAGFPCRLHTVAGLLHLPYTAHSATPSRTCLYALPFAPGTTTDTTLPAVPGDATARYRHLLPPGSVACVCGPVLVTPTLRFAGLRAGFHLDGSCHLVYHTGTAPPLPAFLCRYRRVPPRACHHRFLPLVRRSAGSHPSYRYIHSG